MYIEQLKIPKHMVQAIVDPHLLIPPSWYIGEAYCHEGIGPRNVHVDLDSQSMLGKLRCILMGTLSKNKSYLLT